MIDKGKGWWGHSREHSEAARKRIGGEIKSMKAAIEKQHAGFVAIVATYSERIAREVAHGLDVKGMENKIVKAYNRFYVLVKESDLSK